MPMDADPNLRSLLEGLPAMLWETDGDLRLSSVSGAVSARIQASLGQPAADVFGQGGHSGLARRAHERALEGRGESFRFALHTREFDAHVKPRRGLDGAIDGVIGIALDATERHFAERALRFSEYTYQSFVEDAPYAICRATVSGALLQVNRAMATMLGYSPDRSAELLLRDLPAIFAPASRFAEFQRRLLETGSHPEIDAAWIRGDGEAIQVVVSGRVARYPAGDISHFDIFAADVTEKKRLENELSRAHRMQAIGQLAGGVAHDFNNLLTLINGYSELLLADPQLGTAPRTSAQAIREAGERAATLTRQLLGFSRKSLLQPRVLDLNTVVADTSAMLRRLIGENIILTTVLAPRLHHVKIDPSQLNQVLMNLVVNARDAMPSGGRLTLETGNVMRGAEDEDGTSGRTSSPHAKLSITDTGCGMTPDVMARIFEPFYTTKPVGVGTGLGLAICREIAHALKGRIDVESTPGAGATFILRVPAPGVRAVG